MNYKVWSQFNSCFVQKHSETAGLIMIGLEMAEIQTLQSALRIAVQQTTEQRDLVCISSTPPLAPRIGLYTTSLVSLTDILIGWRASNCDTPTQLLRIQINTGNTAPSPTWRASPTWHKQKAFPLPETVALWVLWTRAVSDCLIRPLPATVNALLVFCA